MSISETIDMTMDEAVKVIESLSDRLTKAEGERDACRETLGAALKNLADSVERSNDLKAQLANAKHHCELAISRADVAEAEAEKYRSRLIAVKSGVQELIRKCEA